MKLKDLLSYSYVLEERGMVHHVGRGVGGSAYGKSAKRVNATKQVGSPERE